MTDLNTLIAMAKELNASDVHIVSGLPVRCRVDGSIRNLTEELLTFEDCENYGKDGCKVRIYPSLPESTLDILRCLSGFKPELLEHETRKTGCGIKRSQAECGICKYQ